MSAIQPDQAIKDALSAARLGTYEQATILNPPLPGALALYAWNAKVSAAMLAPLHICEVVTRNAVSDALTSAYGSNWPWNSALEGSLPNKGHFRMRDHLVAQRNGMPTTGKVIADLNFVFWQKMFTGRFDAQLWNPHLRTVMPNLDASWSVQTARARIYDDLETIRRLRNRIAHHEPIFTRNLALDFQKIQELISYRCKATATWMINNQQAIPFFVAKPP